ncbi:MAG TPA: glucose 1-dehydrogenase [Elusimicrobiales bacterium]|nr:glucose 1-dehydrogenase [Elusimicrobiales bacterium]
MNMRSIVITPSRPGSLRYENIPRPSPAPGEVLVKIVEAGVCRTDIEIYDGLYGEAPAGSDFLVLGHEALGRLENGEFVVPMVRRSCGACESCLAGEPDMCFTGNFVERGIKGLHGMFCEYIAESPRYLVPLPADARAYGVLAEPMSIVAKAVRQAEMMSRRVPRSPKRALVLGAGPIGLLATMVFRLLGLETVTVARRPASSAKAKIVEACGGGYVSTGEVPVPSLAEKAGLFDLILEATGDAGVAFDCLTASAVNGIVCFTSVTGGSGRRTIDPDRVNRELVLGNRTIFGTVNANRGDFETGLSYLKRIDLAYPGLLQKLFTSRVPFEKALSVFPDQAEEIKTIIELA